MNWGKWIIERLPKRLRTVMLFTLCMVYTAFIRREHNEFLEWQKKMKIRMSGSPQVCMLKKVIYDELGVNIEIEEGNGKPYDFIIKTDFSDVDKERQLFALLNRYKLAGKSYIYENSSVSYLAYWDKFVCEKTIAQAEYYWGAFVCERRTIRPETVTLTMNYHYKYDTSFNTNTVYKVSIVASKAIKSDLLITADMYVPGYDTVLNPEFVMKKGDSYFEVETWVIDRHANEKVKPSYDNYYEYKLSVKNIYE